VKQGSKNPFKVRQFTAEIILWAVHWYLQFPISYRDLERMLADRGITVDHTPHLSSDPGLCTRARQAHPSASSR
jgi:hypothetical protein